MRVEAPTVRERPSRSRPSVFQRKVVRSRVSEASIASTSVPDSGGSHGVWETSAPETSEWSVVVVVSSMARG